MGYCAITRSLYINEADDKKSISLVLIMQVGLNLAVRFWRSARLWRERSVAAPVLGSRLKAWAARNLPRSQARWAAAQVVSWSPLGPKESDRPVRSVFPPGTSHRCGRLTRVGRGFSVLVCPTLLVFEAAARTAKIIKRADLLKADFDDAGAFPASQRKEP